MKKLLSLLGAMGMLASTGATVVSCGKKDIEEKKPEEEIKPEVGNSVVKVTIDEDSISKKAETRTVKVEMSKELSNTKNLTLTSDKGDTSILKIGQVKTNAKNKKVYEFEIGVKNDLPKEETTEKLIANLNGKATDGSVEITVSPRSEFDLNLIGQFISEEDIVGMFNNFGNKGFLSIDSGNMSNKEVIYNSIREYVNNVLQIEIVQSILKIDVQTILNMVEIAYLDGTGKESGENIPVASIKITVKDGHADDIDDYHVFGETNVKLAEKKKISELITEPNLENLEVTDPNNKTKLKQAVQNALLAKNTYEPLGTAFKINDIELDQINYKSDTNSGTAKIKFKFNSSIQNDKDIKIKFSISQS